MTRRYFFTEPAVHLPFYNFSLSCVARGRNPALEFNSRLRRVIELHARLGIVGVPVLLGTVTILEDDSRRTELATVLLPDVIDMYLVEEGLDRRNKVADVRVINPELTKCTSILFVLFELDLFNLSKGKLVEDVSHVLLGYASKSHDEYASHVVPIYVKYSFNFYRTYGSVPPFFISLLSRGALPRKKSGVRLPLSFFTFVRVEEYLRSSRRGRSHHQS